MMLIVNIISSFFVAAIMTNLTEWISHKYILHGLGKKKDSFFHFHFSHHNISLKNKFVDPDYKLGFFKSAPYRREVYSLVGLLLLNITWLWTWPMLFYWLMFFTALYFWCHAKSHNDVEWCRKYLSHHYDHHVYDANNNWCVIFPLFDYIFGTRSKGTYDKNGKPIRIKHQMAD